MQFNLKSWHLQLWKSMYMQSVSKLRLQYQVLEMPLKSFCFYHSSHWSLHQWIWLFMRIHSIPSSDHPLYQSLFIYLKSKLLSLWYMESRNRSSGIEMQTSNGKLLRTPHQESVWKKFHSIFSDTCKLQLSAQNVFYAWFYIGKLLKRSDKSESRLSIPPRYIPVLLSIQVGSHPFTVTDFI